jgi:hypothetical protein
MKSKNNIQLNLDDLHEAIKIVLGHLESQGIQNVELSSDYYWEIPEDRLYDPTNEPGEFMLGQLSHDWERISAILSGKNEPIGYALVWLSALIRAIGYQHVR